MRAAKNILKHELIGLETEVVNPTNKNQEGIHGKLINETRDTIVIETGQGDKRITKKNTDFRFFLPNKNIKVKGCYLIGRPEDRIKNKISKW